MRKALLDQNGILQEHGYCQYSGTSVDVPDDFSLTPLKWQYNGSQWVSYTPPPLSDAEKLAEANRQLDSAALLKAVALWCAGRFGVTAQQARTEIAAIYRSLA